MKAENFFYKRGNVETHIPWYPPDPEFLNAWRDEFFQVPGVEKYTFWLCGAVLEPFPTNDVDIIVTGDIISYEHLENVLVSAMRLGFKHRQLIDIAWNNYYKKYLERGRCERRAICCEHFYEQGFCTTEDCTKIAHNIETIVVGNEIIKNDVEIPSPDPFAIQLTESLWHMIMSSPSEKQIQRILAGRVYHYSPVVITADLDFKELVPWP